MKISSPQSRSRRDQSGSAVAVILAMIGIMMIFVAVNVAAVRSLGNELKLIEQQQNQRLKKLPSSATAEIPHD